MKNFICSIREQNFSNSNQYWFGRSKPKELWNERQPNAHTIPNTADVDGQSPANERRRTLVSIGLPRPTPAIFSEQMGNRSWSAAKNQNQPIFAYLFNFRICNVPRYTHRAVANPTFFSGISVILHLLPLPLRRQISPEKRSLFRVEIYLK